MNSKMMKIGAMSMASICLISSLNDCQIGTVEAHKLLQKENHELAMNNDLKQAEKASGIFSKMIELEQEKVDSVSEKEAAKERKRKQLEEAENEHERLVQEEEAEEQAKEKVAQDMAQKQMEEKIQAAALARRSELMSQLEDGSAAQIQVQELQQQAIDQQIQAQVAEKQAQIATIAAEEPKGLLARSMQKFTIEAKVDQAKEVVGKLTEKKEELATKPSTSQFTMTDGVGSDPVGSSEGTAANKAGNSFAGEGEIKDKYISKESRAQGVTGDPVGPIIGNAISSKASAANANQGETKDHYVSTDSRAQLSDVNSEGVAASPLSPSIGAAASSIGKMFAGEGEVKDKYVSQDARSQTKGVNSNNGVAADPVSPIVIDAISKTFTDKKDGEGEIKDHYVSNDARTQTKGVNHNGVASDPVSPIVIDAISKTFTDKKDGEGEVKDHYVSQDARTQTKDVNNNGVAADPVSPIVIDAISKTFTDKKNGEGDMKDHYVSQDARVQGNGADALSPTINNAVGRSAQAGADNTPKNNDKMAQKARAQAFVQVAGQPVDPNSPSDVMPYYKANAVPNPKNPAPVPEYVRAPPSFGEPTVLQNGAVPPKTTAVPKPDAAYTAPYVIKAGPTKAVVNTKKAVDVIGAANATGSATTNVTGTTDVVGTSNVTSSTTTTTGSTTTTTVPAAGATTVAPVTPPAAAPVAPATDAALQTGQIISQEKVQEIAQKLGVPVSNDLLNLGSNDAISSALIDKAVAAGKTEAQINKAMSAI